MFSKFIILFILAIANWRTICGESVQDELICQNQRVPNFFQDGVVSYRMKKAVDLFIGRKGELEQLREVFEKDRMLVVYGSKGIGKTELARNFASGTSNSSSIWIDAESADSIIFAFQELATLIKIDVGGKIPSEILENVFTFFGDKRALFIFDGAPNNIYILNSIQKFMPPSLGIKILVTSKESQWNPSFKTMELGPFSEEESLEFLVKNLDILPENFTDAKTLGNTLKNIPLCLSKAAKYIHDREGYTIADFLVDYSDSSEVVSTTTLDPIEEIIQRELENPQPREPQRSIFEELGVGVGPRRVLIVEQVRPPTNAEIRVAVKNAVEREASKIGKSIENEARRSSKKVEKFFRRLKSDVIG